MAIDKVEYWRDLADYDIETALKIVRSYKEVHYCPRKSFNNLLKLL